jgi:1,4-alpha-glucan branching enzyme
MNTDTIIEPRNGLQFSPKQTIKPINFFYSAPDAETVYLIGDFNEWNPKSHPMQRRERGWWSLQVPLSPGHHQYLFVVDGRPTLDPHAAGTTRNIRYEKVSLVAVG